MRHSPTLWIAVLLPLLLTSCSLFGEKKDAYQRALDRWESRQISNYSFEIQVGCFCTIAGWTPALVVVSDNAVVAATRLLDNEPVPQNELSFIPTVDKLFDIIKSARFGGADSISASYDDDLGFPVTVSIDYIEGAVDDEVSYSVSHLITSEK